MTRKILVPTDLTGFSKNEIRCALSLARESVAELVFVYVTSIPAYELGRLYGEDAFLRSRPCEFNLDHLTRDASLNLRHFIYGHFGGEISGLEWKAKVGLGDVAQGIVSAAFQEEADLIVMGKRRKSGLPMLFSRSISDAVIREAPCPVFGLSPQMVMRPWSEPKVAKLVRVAPIRSTERRRRDQAAGIRRD